MKRNNYPSLRDAPGNFFFNFFDYTEIFIFKFVSTIINNKENKKFAPPPGSPGTPLEEKYFFEFLSLPGNIGNYV